MTGIRKRSTVLAGCTLGLTAYLILIHLAAVILTSHGLLGLVFPSRPAWNGTLFLLACITLTALVAWHYTLLSWLIPLRNRMYAGKDFLLAPALPFCAIPLFGIIPVMLLLLPVSRKRDRRLPFLNLLLAALGAVLLLCCIMGFLELFSNPEMITRLNNGRNFVSEHIAIPLPSAVWGWLQAGMACWFVFAFILIFFIARTAEVNYPSHLKRFGGVAACVVAGTMALAQFTVYRTDARIAELKDELRTLGAALTVADVERDYFHDASADPAWSAFVDLPETNSLRSAFDRLPFVHNYYPGSPESHREKFSDTLAEYVDQIRLLDEIFTTGPVKYAINFKVEQYADVAIGHLLTLTAAGRIYAARIHLALRSGDRLEAMRLYRLSGRVIHSALADLGGWGTLCGSVIERSRSEALGDMLGSQLLNQDDLDEITVGLQCLENAALQSVRTWLHMEIASSDYAEAIIRHNGVLPSSAEGVRYSLRQPLGAPLYGYLTSDYIFTLETWRDILAEIHSEGVNFPYGVETLKHLDTPEFREQLRFRPISRALLPVRVSPLRSIIEFQSLLRLEYIACQVEGFRLPSGSAPESLPAHLYDQYGGDLILPLIYEHGAEQVFYRKRSPLGRFTGYRLSAGPFPKIPFYSPGITVAEPGSFLPMECDEADLPADYSLLDN